MILRKLAFGVSIGILGSSNALLDGFGPGRFGRNLEGTLETAIVNPRNPG